MELLEPTGLSALLAPQSVAVIGASRRRGTIGGEVFHNLISKGFSGPVYPINPGASSVQSVRAYPNIESVPDPVDLAVIAVPAAEVLAQVQACGRKGVKALVVITAGFSEVGAQGREVQEQILACVRAHGMRMVGPNCLGLLNRDPEVSLDATFSPAWPPHGSVSISSQSGALGQAILEYARDLGIGVRHFVSIGNKADVSGNDLLEHWQTDAGTRVILLYLESFGNPRRFLNLARRIARHKPILVVKSGRTESGAKAATSHTGALAGLDVAVDALLGQAGVLRADTIEELFDLAMLLANQPVPRGHRVAIVTNAGGPGIMATDACESHGLQLAVLSDETRETLRSFLPPEASLKNPVDMIASATPDSYHRAVKALLADPGVDSLIALFVPPIVTEANDVAEAICAGTAGAGKTVLTCFMGKHGIPQALQSLRQGHLPSYAFPEAAAIALARAVRYGQWLAKPPGLVAQLPSSTVAEVQTLLANHGQAGWLPPDVVRSVLAAVGVTVPDQEIVQDLQGALRVAQRIGAPVALKVVSETLTHKSDIGGVALALDNASQVQAAYEEMQARLAQQGLTDQVQGVLVQAMAPRGVECFVGATQDPVFGPLVAFGLGGVAVELWRDVVFRVGPLTDGDARDMLDGIRGKALLDGFRGAPAADRQALADVLLRIGALVEAVPALAEMDLNPLIALAPGQGAVAVDARIRLA